MRSDEKQLRTVEDFEYQRAKLLINPNNKSIFERTKVKRIVGGLLRNNPLQIYLKPIRNRSYVNFGCGGNFLSGFLNIDYGWSPNTDLCWNFLKGLPLKSDSFSGVFTEHALEHFTWDDAIKKILPEVLRILKPGGTIRISVPDAEQSINNYIAARGRNETNIEFRRPYSGGNRIPLTPMLLVNNTFRRLYDLPDWGHKMAYDFQTLEYFLHEVGFQNIKRETYMSGRDPKLLVDYKKRESESLYVEASKAIN